MNKKVCKQMLEDVILEDYIKSDEYQYKFYLKRKINDLLPDLSEETIYKAIESANEKVKPPRKKGEFLDIILAILYN